MKKSVPAAVRAAALCLGHPLTNAETSAEKLRTLEPRVLPAGANAGRALAQEIRARLREANDRETNAWKALKGRRDWERYRDERIRALRASLGRFPPAPRDLHVRVAKTLAGKGYSIDTLTLESRPGLVVTANLSRGVGLAAGEIKGRLRWPLARRARWPRRPSRRHGCCSGRWRRPTWTSWWRWGPTPR